MGGNCFNANKPDTHQFKSKWSDSKGGQQSGWDVEVYHVFCQRLEQVDHFCKEEEKNGNLQMKHGQKLIKISLKIDLAQTGPKKRGRNQNEDDDEGEDQADDAGGADVELLMFDE